MANGSNRGTDDKMAFIIVTPAATVNMIGTGHSHQQRHPTLIDLIHAAATHQLNPYQAPYPAEDEYVLFGKMVAMEIKSIGSTAARRALKKAIMNAIYDAQSLDDQAV